MPIPSDAEVRAFREQQIAAERMANLPIAANRPDSDVGKSVDPVREEVAPDV